MGIFQRLKSNPKAERDFNKAMDIYEQLRRFPEHSQEYRKQLRQITLFCRNAIESNERHGDAHVLLANTYFLMFIDGFPALGNFLPLKLAAAVIQHWADEPMNQYPWTKNKENGRIIYSQVEDAVRTLMISQDNFEQTSMQGLKVKFYPDAISQDLFA